MESSSGQNLILGRAQGAGKPRALEGGSGVGVGETLKALPASGSDFWKLYAFPFAPPPRPHPALGGRGLLV